MMCGGGIRAGEERVMEEEKMGTRKIRPCPMIKVVQVLGKKGNGVQGKSSLQELLPQAELKLKNATGVRGGFVLT